jgi:hypothetical protein
MISMTTQAGSRPRPASLRTWQTVIGLAGAVGGAIVAAGAFLPWVETFAGLISIPGVRGSNGRILAGAGILIALAGLYHTVRGGGLPRWLIGIAGFGALGFSGYLLIQLAATMRGLGGSMVLARGGPGLWVCAAGGLLACGTLFLPSPAATARPAAAPALLARIDALRQSVLSRTADLESAGVVRGLQVGLGLVWLLDAGLQFQPYMFGQAFVTQQLMPASVGNPAFLASPAMWASRLIGHDVAAWNSVFAIIQLAIAVGLLWRPAVKAALAGTIGWALAVWWLGEGFGGLLTGTATPVTGAPGAAILYALIAVLAWPRPGRQAGTGSVAATSVLGRWARAVWAALWLGFAYLILQAPVRAAGSLRDAIAANAAGEPGWLAGLDRAAASAAGTHGTVISAVLAVVFVAVAAGVFVPALTRPALVLAVVVALAIWVAGENFGMIFMGNATDPDTGPLLVLLAAAYWPLRAQVSPRGAAGPVDVLAGRGEGR